MLFKLRMRDFVVLSLKMILLMENLSRMKEKSVEKVEEKGYSCETPKWSAARYAGMTNGEFVS